MKILGVMACRGGSKGIPLKNIVNVAGKPLFVWALEAAKKSKIFDRIVMSTDSEEIMNLASQYVEIIHRPPELGADDTLHLPVVQHAVNFLQDFGYYAPYTCILQATSPCVQPFHFVEAKNLMVESNADSVISVAKVPKNFSPYKAVELKDGRLKLLFGEIRNRGILRQNLPETYWNPGLVYLFKTRLLEENTFYGNHVIPLFIDDKYTIDINVPEDLEKAEKRLIELNLKFDHI